MKRFRGVTRREFISAGLAVPGWLAASRLGFGAEQTPGAPSNVKVGGKTVLKSTDLTYLGAFHLPADIGGADPGFGQGLAIRYVGGQVHFFSTFNSGNLFEVSAPALSKSSMAEASVVKNWGNVYGSKRVTAVADGNTTIWGLFWDEPTQRLYWSYGNPYNATDGNDPVFGYTTFSGTSSATPGHYYRLANGGCKQGNCGITSIPTWFQNLYCPGKRLGAGFGGYQSILSTGPVSMGPALNAITPPTGNESDGTALSNTVLVAYPFTNTIYGPPDRGHRDTDFDEEFDGWVNRNGIGYWTWSDWSSQFGVWIDTPTKSGLLFAPIMSKGRCWYGLSDPTPIATIEAADAAHWWYIYNPADLGAVAKGSKKSWEIQAVERAAVSYPGVNYPIGRWQDLPPYMVTGVAFDQAASRVYISIRFGGPGGSYGTTAIHAYSVS